MSGNAELIEAMCALGFSTYEARTYVGLLDAYGQTAYSLSKRTGVPQPKIYEALRKLESRAAAVLVGTTPQRYSATPPSELLDHLRSDFTKKVDTAESAVNRALASNSDAMMFFPEVVTGLRGHGNIIKVARELIQGAHEKIYLSAWIPELSSIHDTLHNVGEREIPCVCLAFGKGKFSLARGHVYRHTSTLHSLYPHHQNRHFALVVDGTTVLWATSIDNAEWSGLIAQDRRLTGLVRSYIRHDIYVQKIYARLAPELQDIFGPGLELLTDISRDLTLQDAIPDSDEASTLGVQAI